MKTEPLLTALREITALHSCDSNELLDMARVIARRALDAAAKPANKGAHCTLVRTAGDCGLSGMLHFDRIETPRIAPEFPGDTQVEYEVVSFFANGRDVLPELREAGMQDYLEELARTALEGPR